MPLLKWAQESGEQIVRIHLMTGVKPAGPPGRLNEGWVRHWEHVFDLAAKHGLHVLPVFAAWAEWNDGSGGHAWHHWHRNPYNAKLGGPARKPAELLADTDCRKLWLAWLSKLVRRWQARGHILGWEVFSELDLVTGSSEAAAVAFMEQAARVIRAADTKGRPVTASLSGVNEWPKLFASDAIDIVQVHPYADHRKFRGRLDEMILWSVRARRRRYGKPVLIGECGLTAAAPRDTLAAAPRAHIGIRHAIWASAVSGAMNGRMLWWEDGYDQYERLDLRTKYKHASAPVTRFVRDVVYTGFRPIEAACSDQIRGAAIGSEQMILGWFRDVQCVPPRWPVRPVGEQTVELTLRGKPLAGRTKPTASVSAWTVKFHSAATGKVVSTQTVRPHRGKLTIPLPTFDGSIAFKARRGHARERGRRGQRTVPSER